MESGDETILEECFDPCLLLPQVNLNILYTSYIYLEV